MVVFLLVILWVTSLCQWWFYLELVKFPMVRKYLEFVKGKVHILNTSCSYLKLSYLFWYSQLSTTVDRRPSCLTGVEPAGSTNAIMLSSQSGQQKQPKRFACSTKYFSYENFSFVYFEFTTNIIIIVLCYSYFCLIKYTYIFTHMELKTTCWIIKCEAWTMVWWFTKYTDGILCPSGDKLHFMWLVPTCLWL